MTFTNPYNRLYHYRSLKTATEHILPKHKLRLGFLSDTNDPRENRDFIFSTVIENGVEIGNLAEKNKEVNRLLRADCKILSFSDDNENYYGYERSRMWVHYGESHKGICLELDKDEFLKENSDLINSDLLKPIRYFEFKIREKYDHITVHYKTNNKEEHERYIKNDFRHEHLEHLYFTKNKEWDSEAEIRLIHFSNNPEYEFVSIKKSLKNIYVGVDFDEANLPKLTSVCPNIDIYKLEFKEVRMTPVLLYEGNSMS
jgi:hypothetical protein